MTVIANAFKLSVLLDN